ncbi:MAG: hypothetical protein ACI82F_002479 [Planctomycetota bacterium]|jgi:hypothetical protein
MEFLCAVVPPLIMSFENEVTSEHEEERDWRRKIVLASRKIQQVHMSLSDDVSEVRELRAALERTAPKVEHLDEQLQDSTRRMDGLQQLLEEQTHLLRDGLARMASHGAGADENSASGQESMGRAHLETLRGNMEGLEAERGALQAEHDGRIDALEHGLIEAVDELEHCAEDAERAQGEMQAELERERSALELEHKWERLAIEAQVTQDQALEGLRQTLAQDFASRSEELSVSHERELDRLRAESEIRMKELGVQVRVLTEGRAAVEGNHAASIADLESRSRTRITELEAAIEGLQEGKRSLEAEHARAVDGLEDELTNRSEELREKEAQHRQALSDFEEDASQRYDELKANARELEEQRKSLQSQIVSLEEARDVLKGDLSDLSLEHVELVAGHEREVERLTTESNGRIAELEVRADEITRSRKQLEEAHNRTVLDARARSEAIISGLCAEAEDLNQGRLELQEQHEQRVATLYEETGGRERELGLELVQLRQERDILEERQVTAIAELEMKFSDERKRSGEGRESEMHSLAEDIRLLETDRQCLEESLLAKEAERVESQNRYEQSLARLSDETTQQIIGLEESFAEAERSRKQLEAAHAKEISEFESASRLRIADLEAQCQGLAAGRAAIESEHTRVVQELNEELLVKERTLRVKTRELEQQHEVLEREHAAAFSEAEERNARQVADLEENVRTLETQRSKIEADHADMVGKLSIAADGRQRELEVEVVGLREQLEVEKQSEKDSSIARESAVSAGGDERINELEEKIEELAKVRSELDVKHVYELAALKRAAKKRILAKDDEKRELAVRVQELEAALRDAGVEPVDEPDGAQPSTQLEARDNSSGGTHAMMADFAAGADDGAGDAEQAQNAPQEGPVETGD